MYKKIFVIIIFLVFSFYIYSDDNSTKINNSGVEVVSSKNNEIDNSKIEILITEPFSVLAVIMLVPAFFIWLEKKTQWKIFEYIPPIIWIFIFPILFSSLHIIPSKAPIYNSFKSFAVPLFIILMLIDVDFFKSIKIAGKGLFIVISGSFGIVIGAAISFFIFKKWLPADSWKGFGSLAGSWIGGTGNMAAVNASLETPGSMTAIVVLADTLIYILWFPVLLSCKKFAKQFNKFVGIKDNECLYSEVQVVQEKEKLSFYHILVLVGTGFLFISISKSLSHYLPRKEPILIPAAWSMLLITTFGLILGFTPLKKFPGTKSLSMAMVYVYMSMLAAECDLTKIDSSAVFFLLAALLCILLHGFFCVLAAKLFKVDIHITAIASAANIGGVASAPIIAGYHKEDLIPISIVFALIGYSLGNYLGFLTGYLCYKLL